MKILVLNYEFPPLGGGAAPVTRDLAIALAKKGHTVSVVTMGFDGLSSYETLDYGVQLFRIHCLRKSKSSCSPIEQLSYLISLRSFMKKHHSLSEYDVCHTHFVFPTGEGAQWISKKYGIPYIITAHGSDVEGHNSKTTMRIMHRVLRASWRGIVRKSNGVVSPSMYLLKRMEGNYPKGSYVFIPNGIDYHLYKNLCSVPKKKQILVMGRLQRFKNVQTILTAISMIRETGWNVVVLGDGPYRDELVELSMSWGLQKIVKFTGWIDNKSPEQLRYIAESSIYVSASEFENCPMSVVETSVAGCYPILSDIPAHRQLLSDDSYFFETHDVDDLYNKIMIAMQKYEEGLLMESIPDMKRYSWDSIVNEYENVLSLN